MSKSHSEKNDGNERQTLAYSVPYDFAFSKRKKNQFTKKKKKKRKCVIGK